MIQKHEVKVKRAQDLFLRVFTGDNFVQTILTRRIFETLSLTVSNHKSRKTLFYQRKLFYWMILLSIVKYHAEIKMCESLSDVLFHFQSNQVSSES